MVRTCIDSTLKELARLEDDPGMFSSMRNQIQELQGELKLLKMFIWCLAKSNGANKYLKPRIEVAFRKTRPRLRSAAAKALKEANSKDWDLLNPRLLKKVKQFKPAIKDTCLDLIDCSLHCKSSYDCYEVFEFLESILECLNYLYLNPNNRASLRRDNMIPAMNQQIVILEKKLRMFLNFYDFDTKLWINHEEFKDLDIQIQSWTYKTACLSLLYWVDNMESKVVLKMNHVFSDMREKATPRALEVATYFGVLKASNSSRSNIFHVAEVVSDDTEIHHEGLIFLVSLLIHPPEGRNLISTQVDAIIKEAASLISSYCFGVVKENIDKEKNVILLSDFLEMVKMIKEKVRQLHVQMPNSSLIDFPKTNASGSMDLLLRNLEEKLKCKYIPFATHQMLAVREGLMFMMPILKIILQLQNECSEIKDLWKQTINVAYTAEHVIDSFSIDDSPIWCNMIRLSNVKEEIESITAKVKKMKDNQMFNIRSGITAEMKFSQILTTTESNITSQTPLFVGFKDEEEAIIDQLGRGSMERVVVSIVGMPGLGKTTLAKKVYDSPFVRSQFHKRAWCCVSQSYKRREFLSAILKDVDSFVCGIQEKSEEELEHLLYKSLKGRRYLIVMDDIWHIDAWEELQKSFPDDTNGSTILLTSRIRDVPLQINPNCRPHFLRSLTDAECWELLTKKLFHRNDCPPYLLEVGMKIAQKCKGLPLAVVVIAGLLAKAVENLGWWRQIEGSVGSHIASSGCMDILELSYNHLPDYLKPCFLYLGAFQEDREIYAKDLTLLWIDEGFILNPGSKSLKEVAKEYLMDLISRNLVLVSSKSSIGGIKKCLIHDVIRELCLKKAKEENFMELMYEDDIKAKLVASRSNPTRHDNYRLSIHADPESFLALNATSPCTRSLLFLFPKPRLRCSYAIHIFHCFKFLNVLRMLGPHYGLDSYYFPTELTLLVHLRYLTLIGGNYTSISPSIANLKNLETCRVITNSALVVPHTIWEMRRLRHVEVRHASLNSGDDDKSEYSNQLDNIQSFSTFALTRVGDLEKLLRRIPRVQTLKLECPKLQKNSFSMLDSFGKLESLTLWCWYSAYPHGYVIRFPSSLKKLNLFGLRLPLREISVIGKLPNLEVLKLQKDAVVGEIWDVEDEEFLNLKCLKLQYLKIAQWNVPSDPFPCLQQLNMENCLNLEEIPSSFATISTLKKIRIIRCSHGATSSAIQIVEEQLDLGNEDLEVDIRQ